MTTPEPAEPPRQVGHFLLLVLVSFVIVGSALVSRRPLPPASLPDIAPVAALPTTVDAAPLARYNAAYGASLLVSDWRPGVARLLGRTGDAPGAPPRLGYWVRQWTFLGLPLFARKEGGYALYVERFGYFRATPLADGQLDTIARQAGGRFWEGWWFPWWRFGWGLLVPLAITAFAWAELRWQARRRTLLGLI